MNKTKITEIVKGRGIIKKTVLSLRDKCGNKCSFPYCNVDLVTNDGRLIGEIATIKPIRDDAPRSNDKASAEEYFSEENLIYLCPTHHRLIDIEPEMYSVEYLKKIKHKHENTILSLKATTSVKIEVPEGLSLDEILTFWNENQENKSEEFWQKFFSNHPQIISLLHSSPIVKLGEKTYFGGKDLENKGGNLGDFVYQNKITSSVVIVEIKTPKTELLGPQYRTNSYSISKELSGAVVQTLNYKLEIQRDFHRLVYESSKTFEVIEPTCFVIVGNLNNEVLNTKQMRSFDLFRNSLNNLTILTYDELFEKIKFIKKLT